MAYTDPEGAAIYLRRQLTLGARRLHEGDPEASPLWYRVLDKAGWTNIRIAPVGAALGKYDFSATKAE